MSQGAKTDPSIFSQSDLDTAIENAQSISYTDFKEQVAAYLMDEYKEAYDSPKKWEVMREKIIQMLTEYKHAST